VYDVHVDKEPAAPPPSEIANGKTAETASGGAVVTEAADDVLDGAEPNIAPAATAAASDGTVLTGARAELVLLNRQIEEASAALKHCAEPVKRLRGLLNDLSRAEQDLITRRARYDAIVGEWIATGCRGDRPPVPPELVAAERELAAATADARAAKTALPAHEAVEAGPDKCRRERRLH
jgi:hypothetical protein